MKKLKNLRLHDEIYIHENRYNNPKESFKFLINLIKKNNIYKKKGLNIGDFGCANGELDFFLKKTFKNSHVFGYDILKPLIDKARKKVKNVKFIHGSILNKDLCKLSTHDISISMGVLSIFDSFEKIVNNLIYWTKPKGKIYLHSFFNDYPFDVNIKYSSSDNWKNGQPKYWEIGYNIFSKKTISNFLKKNKRIKKFKFHDFNIKKKIKINKKDYIRAWTVDFNKKKIITNGLNMIQTFSLVEITLK